MNYNKMRRDYCRYCKNNSRYIMSEPCFSCLRRGTACDEMPNFIRKDDQNMNITLSDPEKVKLEEVGRAMSPEEMREIIKTAPPEILIAEVGRRLLKMEELKKNLNRIYGIASNESTDAKTVDTTLADFSRR